MKLNFDYSKIRKLVLGLQYAGKSFIWENIQSQALQTVQDFLKMREERRKRIYLCIDRSVLGALGILKEKKAVLQVKTTSLKKRAVAQAPRWGRRR